MKYYAWDGAEKTAVAFKFVLWAFREKRLQAAREADIAYCRGEMKGSVRAL